MMQPKQNAHVTCTLWKYYTLSDISSGQHLLTD